MAVTTNNGYFSDYLHIQRSCHQGCPAAPLLYLACGEVLSREILKNSGVKGIKLNELENIIGQFADDTQLFLRNKIVVEEVIKTLTDIKTNIGLKVNYDKSSIHCIADATPFKCSKPIIWDPGGTCILGVNVFDDPQQGYQEILDKIHVVTQAWYYRQLSLKGKVVLINALMGSFFVYHMQVAPNPSQNIIKEYETIVHQFLWKNKKAKISLQQLKAPIDKGGLKLTDIRSKNAAIKIAWVFCTDPFALAQLERLLPIALGTYFWDCDLNETDCAKYMNTRNLNPFWSSVVQHWFQFKKVTNYQPFLDTIIWFNSYICINNGIVNYTKAIDKGIIFLNDILNEYGQLLEYHVICQKYPNAMNWLEYNSLRAKIVSYVYNHIITKNCAINGSYAHFVQNFHIDIEQYEKAFVNINKVTNIVKYRDFQYRLLCNAIHTNNRLFHWKIVTSKRCEYCDAEMQDIKHLMYACPIIANIWKKFSEYVENEMKVAANILEYSLYFF